MLIKTMMVGDSSVMTSELMDKMHGKKFTNPIMKTHGFDKILKNPLNICSIEILL